MEPAPRTSIDITQKARDLAKGIGWLSGSLAGVCAILTVCGYLATMAHLHMLGLDSIANAFSTEFQLRRGGNFFFYVLALTSEKVILPISILSLLAFMLCVCVAFVASRWPFSSAVDALRRRLGGLFAGRVSPRRGAYLLLVLVLLSGTGGRIDRLLEPLAVEGVLFAQADTTSPPVDSVSAALVRGDVAELEFRFFEIMVSTFVAAALLLAALWTSAGARFQWLLAAPFFVVFLIYVIFLPLAYGVLILKPHFPSALLNSSPALPGDGPLFLLTESNDEFVLWDPARRKIVRGRRDDVHSLEIGRAESILSDLRGPSDEGPRHGGPRP